MSCGGLESSIRTDFQTQTAVLEMQVLGLLGKILTGPWMQKFYTNADSETDHIQGISLVQNVIDELKKIYGGSICQSKFSAGHERAKNATLCFPSTRMQAKKNKVVPYLDAMSKKKLEQVVTWAIGMARKEEIKSKETGRDKRGTF